MSGFKMGMVHGRFQPFHNGHLDYVLSGIEKCDHCVIGITNPDPSELILETSSSHRHEVEANPYTYFQRYEMVKQSISDMGIDLRKISIVPFHIFHPAQWQSYIPVREEIVHLVRIFSDWELKKISWLKDYGFEVVVIDEGIQKQVTGTEIRYRIRKHLEWRSFVPNATARMVETIKI
jgi:nicotinamide-nucleotide adenylyltransferase